MNAHRCIEAAALHCRACRHKWGNPVRRTVSGPREACTEPRWYRRCEPPHPASKRVRAALMGTLAACEIYLATDRGVS